jgi:hypothetical protein
MARARDESTGAPAVRRASVPAETWLKDCWLLEIMPPTWAWAYRRLLCTDETVPGRSRRIA